MKIACIDSSAQHRLILKSLLESAFEACRSFIGHAEAISIVPYSIDEIAIQRKPDVCIVGPGFTADQAAGVCLQLRKHFTSGAEIPGLLGTGALSMPEIVPIFVVVSHEIHELRTLRRFEQIAADVFHSGDRPARIVHKILQCGKSARRTRAGKTVAVCGVKGGVGATSISAGLAHAAQAAGRSVVLVDLSAAGSLAAYAGTARSSAPEFAALLQDGRSVDRLMVERSLTTAPNGLVLFLPPGLSADIRDLWLRDPKKFELTLDIVDHLECLFDLVIIDLAGAEGILPFALQSRAFSRLLVTADDPASINLLARRLEDLKNFPGYCRNHLLINSISKGGISRRDIFDFLLINEWFDPLGGLIDPIPFDQRARDWIGTGNSFYTESSPATRRLLEQAVRLITLDAGQLELETEYRRNQATGISRWIRPSRPERSLIPRFLRELPAPSISCSQREDAVVLIGNEQNAIKRRNETPCDQSPEIRPEIETEGADTAQRRRETAEVYFYRHPKVVSGDESSIESVP